MLDPKMPLLDDCLEVLDSKYGVRISLLSGLDDVWN